MIGLILRQANWGVLGSIFGFVIGFFVKIYLIDIVGVDEWGKYVSAQAFSGIMSAANKLVRDGKPFEAVCWSLQEHAFAACIEVAERALAHTGKTEILLGGGVACNQRMRDMSTIMCEERGASSHCPPRMYCIDNGTMIALLGWLELNHGRTTSLLQSGVDQELRTDQTPISWP